jgi:hypothetical protein
VQFFTDALEKDSEIGASKMLEEFLKRHLENPLVGFDDHREMLMGGVTMSFEADGTTSNYMGWGRCDWTRMSGHFQHSFKNTHYKQRGT